MTPTPLPTPSYVVQTVIEQGLSVNYMFVIGAIWAVCFLYVVAFITDDRQRTMLFALILVICSFPVLLINAGWWAMTNYIFFLMYRLIVGLKSIV